MSKEKLTFCGSCHDCGRFLTLITVHKYFGGKILGYRGFCSKCNKKTEVHKTIKELIDNPC